MCVTVRVLQPPEVARAGRVRAGCLTFRCPGEPIMGS
jgi:hypothetical protein